MIVWRTEWGSLRLGTHVLGERWALRRGSQSSLALGSAPPHARQAQNRIAGYARTPHCAFARPALECSAQRSATHVFAPGIPTTFNIDLQPCTQAVRAHRRTGARDRGVTGGAPDERDERPSGRGSVRRGAACRCIPPSHAPSTLSFFSIFIAQVYADKDVPHSRTHHAYTTTYIVTCSAAWLASLYL